MQKDAFLFTLIKKIQIFNKEGIGLWLVVQSHKINTLFGIVLKVTTNNLK